MKTLARVLDYFLLPVVIVVLALKVLNMWLGWFGPYIHALDQLMVLLVGVYGIVNGVRLIRSFWGVISLIAGLLIILTFYTNILSVSWTVIAICIVVILVIAFVGPRAVVSRRR